MSTISIDIVFNAVNKAMPAITKLNQGFGSINGNLWKVNQAAEAWTKTSQTIDQVSQPFRGYNEGLAELESITGITGTELQELGKTARKTGKESGLGATGAIEAYKLLASQIDVSKIGMSGLNDLQSKAITLAQASKMSMGGAADALAGTINQFGLEATDATRVINMLAAGSKWGAAEIPDLAQSFKVAGAYAAASGLSLESAGGAIEALSKNSIKGAEAGTALRNIWKNMQVKMGVDFNTTSFSDALASLKGKEGDAKLMDNLFGEYAGAAQFLIKNNELVDEMTMRMTNTNTATEQANVNNKTFNHWLDVSKAKISDLSIAIFKHNEGLLKGVTGLGQFAAGATSMLPLVAGIGKGVTGAAMGIANVGKASKLMNAAMAAGKLGTYSALIERYGAAGKLAAVGISIKTGAQTAWNAVCAWSTATLMPLIASTWAWTAALAANPITWVVVGVAALIAGLALAWKHFDGFRGAVVGSWEGMKQFGVILWQSIIDPLKQIIGGIGAVGKAIGLMFKGKFGEAAATAKEGFANIAEGAVKSSPIGVAVNVASRRQEISDKAAAGYQKGKAIDTSNFLSFGKKKGKPETEDQQPGEIGKNFAASLPKQGLNNQMDWGMNAQDWKASGFSSPETPVDYQPTMKVVKSPSMAVSAPVIPATINAAQPSMKVVKAPGMVDPMDVPQPAGVTVPGDLAMNWPSAPGMNIPATINTAAPSVPGMNIPGTINAAVPSVPGMNIPGQISASTPTVPGVTIPGTIDANQPDAKPMTIPGIVSITTPKIDALNVSGTGKPETGNRNTKELPDIEALTRNVTTNIQKNVTNNSTATNNDSTAKIEVTYSPVINISSAMDAKATDDLMKMLADNKDQLMKLINEEMRRNDRLRYAG